MKKFILIPTILTLASTPLISLVGCNKPKDEPVDPTVINVNLNKGKSLHLESKPFSLEKDITYTLKFDLSQWRSGSEMETGLRLILFSNQYLPNITSFIYRKITFTKTNNIEDIGKDIYKYYVGQSGDRKGVFFCNTYEGYGKEFNVKFLSDIEVENITVELNGY